MASYTILYHLFTLVVSVLLISFGATEAWEWDDPFYLYQYCSSNRTTDNASFQSDLTTLLTYLSSNATHNNNTQFYNTTFTRNNPSDTFYGMFMCRSDVPSQLCQKCVVNATQRLSSECSLSKEGVFWYDECMVRYSTSSIFSNVATKPSFSLFNTDKISNPKTFMRLLSLTMNQTADEAARSPNKFGTQEANVSEFQTLYCLAQCTPDLLPNDCRTCLSGLIPELPTCCEGRVGGRVLNPSCHIRYEFYPFYLSSPVPASPAALVPQTKNNSDADSRFSQDPVYLSYNCSRNKTLTSNSTFHFQAHLTTLLSYLSSNATYRKFHKADVADKVFGLFMCRGDVPLPLCENCVKNATHRIASACGSIQEAIIWYSHCLLRYSYRNFFSEVSKSPVYSDFNVTNNSSPNQERDLFNFVVSNALSKVAIVAGDSGERYGTKSLKLNDLQTLYALGQCTQDLSSDDCKGCLGDLIGPGIPWSRLGSVGGRVLYPSCNLRFELFQFYRDVGQPTRPFMSSPSAKRRKWSRTITLIVLLTFVSMMMLFFIGYYLRKRAATRSFSDILRENFGHEGATLEPLQMDLSVIEAATNNFSYENYIGKGGFGEVYKGILLDGRQIAVKRLSTSSWQGANEFKNEVLLIAKLQHRNLVEFIGFCLEEQEKMLIYEYVPKKSLDHFLFGLTLFTLNSLFCIYHISDAHTHKYMLFYEFDFNSIDSLQNMIHSYISHLNNCTDHSQRPKILSWFERYNIIGGIAQGILYLHEHSRLKVIHRDLKPSNILLDENMVPKISDFGLARIVELNQDKGSTNRIVGTLGYMSPEYAMLGQFSEKSDVYSFGVLVLEIITGKKNVSSSESRVGDSLLCYVWRQWRDEISLSILDPNIQGSYSEIEVIKCIQIGLLCVQQFPNARPTMVEIVSYLSNQSIELPTPQEPAFFFPGKMHPRGIAQESGSSQYNNSSTQSINDMSITELIPR